MFSGSFRDAGTLPPHWGGRYRVWLPLCHGSPWYVDPGKKKHNATYTFCVNRVHTNSHFCVKGLFMLMLHDCMIFVCFEKKADSIIWSSTLKHIMTIDLENSNYFYCVYISTCILLWSLLWMPPLMPRHFWHNTGKGGVGCYIQGEYV